MGRRESRGEAMVAVLESLRWGFGRGRVFRFALCFIISRFVDCPAQPESDG